MGLKSVEGLMRGCIRMMAKDRTVTTVPVVFQRTSYEMVFTKFRTSVKWWEIYQTVRKSPLIHELVFFCLFWLVCFALVCLLRVVLFSLVYENTP